VLSDAARRKRAASVCSAKTEAEARTEVELKRARECGRECVPLTGQHVGVRTCVRAVARIAHAQFRRSLNRGNLTAALSAARELPHVSLEDALELVLLIREKEPERYGRAAAR
jgi:hypothetical protein